MCHWATMARRQVKSCPGSPSQRMTSCAHTQREERPHLRSANDCKDDVAALQHQRAPEVGPQQLAPALAIPAGGCRGMPRVAGHGCMHTRTAFTRRHTRASHVHPACSTPARTTPTTPCPNGERPPTPTHLVVVSAAGLACEASKGCASVAASAAHWGLFLKELWFRWDGARRRKGWVGGRAGGRAVGTQGAEPLTQGSPCRRCACADTTEAGRSNGGQAGERVAGQGGVKSGAAAAWQRGRRASGGPPPRPPPPAALTFESRPRSGSARVGPSAAHPNTCTGPRG